MRIKSRNDKWENEWEKRRRNKDCRLLRRRCRRREKEEIKKFNMDSEKTPH